MTFFGEVEMGDLGVGREDRKDFSCNCKLYFCFLYGLVVLVDWREEILWLMVGRLREILVVLVEIEGGAGWNL